MGDIVDTFIEHSGIPEKHLDSNTVIETKAFVMAGLSHDVLIPASRFIPRCNHRNHRSRIVYSEFGDSTVATIKMWCGECLIFYDQELSYGVEGIPHGQV